MVSYLHVFRLEFSAGYIYTSPTRATCSAHTILYGDFNKSRDSSLLQRWTTDWMTGGFESRQGLGMFLFTTSSRTTLGPTKHPIQWVPGTLPLRVKRPGLEANHSPPSSAEVKKCVELYLHSPNMPSWRGAQLKTRRQLYFTLRCLQLISHLR